MVQDLEFYSQKLAKNSQKEKKISKKFEFKAKTGAKMTKKQDYFKPKLEF